jgi:2-succinyl-5-enolpyruvyl-6-hydroxy-3-cyclohexene-1-carboxylate synthase
MQRKNGKNWNKKCSYLKEGSLEAETNAQWAKLIVGEIYAQGVNYFCVAPGSRNTALLLAAARHPLLEHMVHWDERAVGFHALGYAKGAKNPACTIVTSGTAVANLLPSIMEAYYSKIPMLILTADRPPELRDCGSNQTADQVKIFQNFVRWQFDLPCPGEALSDSFVREVIAYAVFRSKSSCAGPVHINCMFREPLFAKAALPHRQERPKTAFYEAKPVMKAPLPFPLPQKGIILMGRDAEESEWISKLAHHLKWPIFPDLLSEKCVSPFAVPSYDLLLKTAPHPSPEAIFHFGDRFISKKLLEWLSKLKLNTYAYIAEHNERFDPSHQFTHRLLASTPSFCESVIESTQLQEDSSWFSYWQQQEQQCATVKVELFENSKSFSESEIVYHLGKILPKDWGLFFGNSMPIRDADNFLHADTPHIFANRGTSGIDGNIATSIGIANGLKRPIVCCLGDLAFLHDLAALAQLEKSPYPVIILVFNNSGGGIFSFLPVSQEEKHFDQFFKVKHSYTFEKIAEQFNLPYFKAFDLAGLDAITLDKSCVIEAVTSAEKNVEFRKRMERHLKELCPV